MIHVLFMKY